MIALFDIVKNVIFGSSITAIDESVVLAICGVLVVIFSVVFIDLIRDIFRAFLRG